MKWRSGAFLPALCLVAMITGCQTADPAAEALARMDRMSAAQRPKNWDQTKRWMARKAPVVGEPAPDFSLRTLGGKAIVTRSTYQNGRPLVLIFGSFT